MKEQMRLDVLALCDASARMRDATNNLFWAEHPEECTWKEGKPPTIDEARENHISAFRSLERAEYYVRKSLDTK